MMLTSFFSTFKNVVRNGNRLLVADTQSALNLRWCRRRRRPCAAHSGAAETYRLLVSARRERGAERGQAVWTAGAHMNAER